MNSRIPAAVSLLLCAMAAGTVAEDQAQLPDMSRALEVRINGRMNDSLNARGDRTAGRNRQAGRSAVRAAEQDGATTASGRTDGGGWKPYHSAM